MVRGSEGRGQGGWDASGGGEVLWDRVRVLSYRAVKCSGKGCDSCRAVAQVELKGVDRQFMAKVGRKATKAEKESLRPWYVRYWRLKHALTKQAGGSGQDEEDEM